MFEQFTYMAPPLEDNSDAAYRRLCYTHGADVTFTEMTRLKSVLKGNKSSLRKIAIPDNTPTIIQFLVSQEKEVEEYLSTFEPPKGFIGFNLNMGCPSPQLIKLGLGCAFIKRIEKTQKIVCAFQRKGYQISVKLRLGTNQFEKEKKVYLNLIQNVSADFFIVHTRHGKQTYDQKADFSVYSELVATGKNIVANGDIQTIEQVELLKSLGVKGAMIGRGAVYNPAIFDLLKGNSIPSFIDLQNEYMQYTVKYDTSEKYISNMYSRIGKVKDISLKSGYG